MVDTPEARRFAEAVAMADQGIELMRQNLRRHDLEASDEEIDRRLASWLVDRPMDAPGRVTSG